MDSNISMVDKSKHIKSIKGNFFMDEGKVRVLDTHHHKKKLEYSIIT